MRFGFKGAKLLKENMYDNLNICHSLFCLYFFPEMCVVRGGSSNGLQPKYIACSSFFSFHVVFAFK